MTISATNLTTENPSVEIASDSDWKDVVVPPGDLYSDEPPLESSLHLQQLVLLLKCLEWLWRDRTDYFCAGNLTIYYSPRQRKSEDFRGPDFFVVLGAEKRPRKSWVVWEENGQYPHVIVELLSDSTATTDRGFKKQLYQDTFRTLDYFWFDPESLEFQGFHLVDGQYEAIVPNAAGLLWSQQLGLYLGVYEQQLRFFTASGELVLTPEESHDRLTESHDRLAAKLRELGVDPDALG
ncbi:Uma2 family endonuclease [Alkalinema sp. FACHB-956]|uniref:Uma2 family endonuclease n=1 Tax=Alkalinema sp. FACHB-956 TaxID=2692768 RepID=UPI001688FE16|nr:Uma2 family endonuclease [Alkalinema sp. FACHB-956]MBD2327398.1 Uma2 family endonuclease [Alkalinema sp. FACHB-956]